MDNIFDDIKDRYDIFSEDKLVVFDLETTGLSYKQDDMIQLAKNMKN